MTEDEIMARDVRYPTQPEGEYVAANPSNPADPVGRHGEADWGFWDESWSHWHGGYADETEARTKLAEYCTHL
jgi:hypothetical protein